MSKTSKKCQYKIQRGEKKGEKCGRSCQGKFCFAHTEKNIQYQKKYNDKRNEEDRDKSLEKKIKKIEQGKISLPDRTVIMKKITDLDIQRTEVRQIGYGCFMAIDPKYTPPLRSFYRNMFASEEFLAECKERYAKRYSDSDSDNEDYIDLNEFIKQEKERIIQEDIHFRPYVPVKKFIGTPASAKKKLLELAKQEKELNNKIDKLKRLKTAIDKKSNKNKILPVKESFSEEE